MNLDLSSYLLYLIARCTALKSGLAQLGKVDRRFHAANCLIIYLCAMFRSYTLGSVHARLKVSPRRSFSTTSVCVPVSTLISVQTRLKYGVLSRYAIIVIAMCTSTTHAKIKRRIRLDGLDLHRQVHYFTLHHAPL